jgi:hypothetical protein
MCVGSCQAGPSLSSGGSASNFFFASSTLRSQVEGAQLPQFSQFSFSSCHAVQETSIGAWYLPSAPLTHLE